MVGYAYSSQFRPRPAYAHTRETSIYRCPTRWVVVLAGWPTRICWRCFARIGSTLRWRSWRSRIPRRWRCMSPWASSWSAPCARLVARSNDGSIHAGTSFALSRSGMVVDHHSGSRPEPGHSASTMQTSGWSDSVRRQHRRADEQAAERKSLARGSGRPRVRRRGDGDCWSASAVTAVAGSVGPQHELTPSAATV